MKKILYILIFLGFSGTTYALTVSGRIVDSVTKKPVKGIVVGIEELNIITETNNNGEFSFSKIDRGYYSLVLSNTTYGKQTISIRVKREFYIDIPLEPVKDNEVTTTNVYNDELETTGKASIKRDDIKRYPMRGFGDSLHLLHTLPGIGSGYSMATVPIIRGTNPLYNKYYIDDIPIDFPYHYVAGLIPVFSNINEEAIHSAEVIRGNAPVWSNDNLGNIIHIKSAEADTDSYRIKIGLDPLLPLMPTISAAAVPDKDLSIIIVARRSTVDWIFDYKDLDTKSEDYFSKIQYNPVSNHRITLLNIYSRDKMNYKDKAAGSESSVNGLTWDFLINNNLFLKTVLSNQHFEQLVENNKSYTDRVGVYIKFNPDEYRLYQMLTYTLKQYYIKAGYETIRYNGECKGNVTLSDISDPKYYHRTSTSEQASFPVEGYSLAAFTHAGGTINKFLFDIGGRYESYTVLNRHVFSYTAELGYPIDKKSFVYSAMGKYYAHPDVYYYLGNLDPHFELAEADNYKLGMNYKLSKSVLLNSEIYYSTYDNLSPAMYYNVDNEYFKKLTQLQPFANEKSGSTYGIELSAKGGLYGFTGWINYSFSVAKRNNDQTKDFLSDFDQTHKIRIVLSHDWRKFTGALIWNMSTSLPYTPAEGPNGNLGYYGSKNSAHYGMYRRLDLKANYKTENGNRFFVECWNVLFEKNTIFQDFSSNKPISDSNPGKVKDIPFLIWIGGEICL
jgi:hypothetical protein